MRGKISAFVSDSLHLHLLWFREDVGSPARKQVGPRSASPSLSSVKVLMRRYGIDRLMRRYGIDRLGRITGDD